MRADLVYIWCLVDNSPNVVKLVFFQCRMHGFMSHAEIVGDRDFLPVSSMMTLWRVNALGTDGCRGVGYVIFSKLQCHFGQGMWNVSTAFMGTLSSSVPK